MMMNVVTWCDVHTYTTQHMHTGHTLHPHTLYPPLVSVVLCEYSQRPRPRHNVTTSVQSIRLSYTDV